MIMVSKLKTHEYDTEVVGIMAQVAHRLVCPAREGKGECDCSKRDRYAATVSIEDFEKYVRELVEDVLKGK